MASGFISMVYAVLKQHDIDTSGMSVDEAIRKFDELQGTKGEQSNGGGEAKRVFDKADELGVDYDRDTNYQSLKAKVDDAQKNDNVVELSDDNELARLIASSDENKYKVIKDYLIKNFAGRTFELSDGLKAQVDNGDAKELSHGVTDKKVAEISEFEKLISSAKYDNQAENVQHKRFDEFKYYVAKTAYKGRIYSLWINVGLHKYDKKWHIYSITPKNN